MEQFIYIVIIFLSTINYSKGELFSSIIGLTELLKTEKAVQNFLEQYVEVEETKITIIKEYLSLFKSQSKNTEIDRDKITNPINAYFLIRRLFTYCHEIVPVLRKRAELPDEKLLKFPSRADWRGASSAIERIQRIYNLPLRDLADGKIFNVSYGEELSSHDCFIIGLNAIKQEHYAQAEGWFREAYRRHAVKDYQRSEIAEKLIDSLYEQGNFDAALDVATDLASSESHNERIKYQRDELRKLVKDNAREPNEISDKPTMEYEELCRKMINVSEDGHLKCFYKKEGHPFLTIAPFKIEQVNIEPDILVFHDVLSDVEIMTIIDKSKQLLEKAAVWHETENTHSVDDHRVAQTAWLMPSGDDKLLDTITRRVEDISGLSQTFSELLHVGNYGFGGHYVPHFDFRKKKNFNPWTSDAGWMNGNRQATVLFYLNDVEYGGATVFPVLQRKILPKKGSAVFWHNLHSTGDGDTRTLHGACPVLLGTKWIATKWMHEYGQEFLRPCALVKPPDILTA